MLIQGQVGPIVSTTSVSPGINAPMRQGNMGDQIVSQYMGRYSEATYRRQTFTIANQAGVTHSAALTTSFIGICVGNPASSTVNLHILNFGWSLIVALAANASIGIMTGVGTVTSALTPRNRYVGGAAGQGLATGGMTLPGTPVLEQVFGFAGSTLAVTSWQPSGLTNVDLGGSLILPPNTFAASYMTTASGASGFIGSFNWAEIPI
jgi:hypothetical protein